MTKEMIFKLGLKAGIKLYKVKGMLRQRGRVGSEAQKNKNRWRVELRGNKPTHHMAREEE